MSNPEATSEHSVQPVTHQTGWRDLQHALAQKVPTKLAASQRSRRGLRRLTRTR
jgi:hypothetical protein